MKKLYIFLATMLLIFANAQQKTSIATEISKIYKPYNDFNENFKREKITPLKIELQDTKDTVEAQKITDKIAALEEQQTREAAPLQKKKLQDLKNLLEKVNAENPIIGKVATDRKSEVIQEKISPPQPNEEIVQNGTKYSPPTVSYRRNDNENTPAIFITAEDIAKIRNAISESSEIYWLEDLYETNRCMVHGIIDSDGKIKNLSVDGDAEFAYVIALALYEENLQLTRYYKDGYYWPVKFAVPVSMYFNN